MKKYTTAEEVDYNNWIIKNDSDSLSNDAYVEEMENKLKQVMNKNIRRNLL